MEEFLTKQLASAGLGIGGVLVIAYLMHELSRLQKFVEDELAELRNTVADQGEKIGLLAVKDAVLEERIKTTRGGAARRRDD